MDENYLDSLLNEISLDNEIELEKQQMDTNQQLTDSFNQEIAQDARTKLSAQDDITGTSAFDELDELDKMADLDFADLDFADIDFDDLDMLNTSTSGQEPELHTPDVPQAVEETVESQDIDLENLSIDDMFFEKPVEDEADMQQAFAGVTEPEPMPVAETMEPVFAPAVDALEPELTSSAEMMEQGGVSEDDLSDLMSILGIEEETGSTDSETMDVQEMPDLGLSLEQEMSDNTQEAVSPEDASIEDRPHPFLQLLFGSDEDEPELSDEELEAIRAEKKAKREAKKAEKKARAEEKAAQKSEKEAAANSEKAAKRAVKQAKRKQEAEAAIPDKKLNQKAVAAVWIFFAIVLGVIVMGTNTFNYKLIIRKAANYFERQKYHMAYDEIAGVDVKEEDEVLEDKIYTVMYVERLYESYDIHAKLGAMDKALDCLLRGLVKYDEHYAEAEELGIVADIDSSRAKIVTALQEVYDLSVEDGYAILALDSQGYRERLMQYAQMPSEEAITLE